MRALSLICLLAGAAHARDAGVALPTPIDGIVSSTADGGVRLMSLADLAGAPFVAYVECRECGSSAFDPGRLAEVVKPYGLPVLVLLYGKSSSRSEAERYFIDTRLAGAGIAYGKKLTRAAAPSLGLGSVIVFGADGKERTNLSLFGSDDLWLLDAALEKVLLERDGKVEPPPRQHFGTGWPFPSALIDELAPLSSDAGAAPKTIDGYLGTPYVAIVACSVCVGADEDLRKLAAELEGTRVQIIALVDAQSRERFNEFVTKMKLGSVRYAWVRDMILRSTLPASTIVVVDRRSIVQAVLAGGSYLSEHAWVLHAAIEHAQRLR